ncbi:hypothetical protein B0J14DRAFT_593990 [Halenospora varia]|nr:hypothetical protein B0J14DRAFT_593990 [Halenospora varia]
MGVIRYVGIISDGHSFSLTVCSGMAYGIMGGSRDSHMLTYQTTRRAKCIYFDGESATLFGSGQLDTQMLHIWGNLTGPPRPDGGFRGLYDEYARAQGLCDWLHSNGLGGSGWGYEGIIRMNAGFEMIWCNFSSPSIRLVAHLNVTAPLLTPAEDEIEAEETGIDVHPANVESTSYFPLPPHPTRTDISTDPTNPPMPPVGGRDRLAQEPFYRSQAWNWFLSGTAHYGSSGNGPGLGESRVKLITCGFLSYYSPIFTGQSQARGAAERALLNLTEDGYWMGPQHGDSRRLSLNALTRRRRYHVLENITSSDAALMKGDSERILRDLLSLSPSNCSGIDWTVITNGIVQTYAIPLAIFSQALEAFENVALNNQSAIRSWMTKIRDQSHTFLLPFLEYPEGRQEESVWTRGSALFNNTYSRCRFQHTRVLGPEEGIQLGPEEELVKLAIEDTAAGLCSVLVEVGLAVEGTWQSAFQSPSQKTPPSFAQKLKSKATHWTEGVQEVMAWLGWAGEWTRCDKKCAIDEQCFIPMWPMIPRMGFGGPGRGYPPGNGTYGRPRYGRPPYPYHGFPSNRTRGPGGPGRGWFQQDETALWTPICVKSDYFSG